jgi:hypothetical protein
LVTVKWIAERLGMVRAGYVNNRLYRCRKGMLKSKRESKQYQDPFTLLYSLAS